MVQGKHPRTRTVRGRQAPNNIQNPMTEIRSLDIRKLEVIWSLVFGDWDLSLSKD
jgi:hypothetical protein